jgi:Secretion system C-terminal sorting domain
MKIPSTVIKTIGLSFSLAALGLMAQAPKIPQLMWEKTIGGPSLDFGIAMQKTPDNGYLLMGTNGQNGGHVSGNKGKNDAWMVKANPSGQVIWQKSLGGTADDWGNTIDNTADGGYLVGCDSSSNNGDFNTNQGFADAWVLKLNAMGDVLWKTNLGASREDHISWLQKTPDGGCIAVGYSNSINGPMTGNHGGQDAWICKLDASGQINWFKVLGEDGEDGFEAVVNTKDGGYVACGYLGTQDNADEAWVMKFDASGNTVWDKRMGGTGYDYALSIAQLPDETYIVSGSSDSNDGDISGNHGDTDAMVFQLNPSGDMLWQKSYGGSMVDNAYSIQPTMDGGYIIAGTTESNNGQVTNYKGNGDVWIIKTDASGNLTWEKTFGGTAEDMGYYVIQNPDASYSVSGYTTSANTDVSFNNGLGDLWIFQLREVNESLGLNGVNENQKTSIYPNPAKNEIQVNGSISEDQAFKYQIRNAAGQLLREAQQQAGQAIAIADLPSGYYFINIENAKGKIQVYTFIKS